MDQLHKDRLLRLASFLEGLPKKKFDFSAWASKDWRDTGDDVIPEPSCGTTACALGWAATLPEFRALGLRLYRYTPKYDDPVMVVALASDIESGDVSCYPWEMANIVAGHVFGLMPEESEWLFIPSDETLDGEFWGLDGKPPPNAPPQIVAQHIREFVNAGGIPGSADEDDEDA